MKSVYILLTRSQTYVGRFIHLMTGDEYTHVSLALDRDLERLYSFGRKYMHFALPGGFIPENIHGGIYQRYSAAQTLIYELTVSQEVYDQIEYRINRISPVLGTTVTIFWVSYSARWISHMTGINTILFPICGGYAGKERRSGSS